MPIETIPAAQVFKVFTEDFGMTKDGRRTKNPWTYDPLPDEIAKAPVEYYIYNVGPLTQVINAGSMGQHYLFPPAEGQRFGKPLEIRKYMVDWADQGDYKHKSIIMNGADVAREWVTPNGDRDTDLSKWGVFYTKSNPPTEVELAAAEHRVHLTLDGIIKVADNLYQDPKKRDQITDVYRIAARKLMIERPWCSVSKEMTRCEGCGKAVERDIAKCACGAVLDWTKARKLRLVSAAEFEEAVADGLVPLGAAHNPPKQASEANAPARFKKLEEYKAEK